MGESDVMTFDSLDDPIRVMCSKGFTVGKYVFEKQVGTSAIYCVKEVTVEGAKIVLHNLGRGARPTTAVIPAAGLLKAWSLLKGDPPMEVPSTWMLKHSFHTSEQVSIEATRAKLFLALKEYEETCKDTWKDSLSFSVRPSHVTVSCDVKKGGLKLCPAVTLDRITAKKEAGAIEVLGPTKMYLRRAAQPCTETVEKWPVGTTLIPYFWVNFTSDPDAVNMTSIMHKSTCFEFPILVNKFPIKKYTQLLAFKAKPAIEPLKGAEQVKNAKRPRV